MAGARILYCVLLVSCGIFSVAHGQWLSWILLMALLGLPWLSLLLSLPAILGFRLQIQGADAVTRGQEGEVWLVGSSNYPLPPFRGRLMLQHGITGQRTAYDSGRGLPTAHCGGIAVSVDQARVCDYLGLFAFPIRRRDSRRVLVRPVPEELPEPPDLKRYIAGAWRPKFGGGYSENHELRLYRPGDGLNQVHWKLSAKTGKLTIREPMEPHRGLVLLTMDLGGSPEALDRKLGRLLRLGTLLLEEGLRYELRVLTGKGVLSFGIGDEPGLQKAMDTLLCTPMAREGSLQDRMFRASWQYHIGGDADEGE